MNTFNIVRTNDSGKCNEDCCRYTEVLVQRQTAVTTSNIADVGFYVATKYLGSISLCFLNEKVHKLQQLPNQTKHQGRRWISNLPLQIQQIALYVTNEGKEITLFVQDDNDNEDEEVQT